MAITTLLLDADGVVQTTPDFWPGMLSLLGDEDIVRAMLATEARSASGHRDVRADLTQFLAEHGLDVTFDDLFGVWSTMTPVPEVLDLVAAVRARGVGVHLATNQQAVRGAHMIENLGYDQVFDSSFYSFQLGLAKPDPAYFTAIVTSLGVDPAQTLFVDDLAVNAEGARTAGLRGEQVTHTSTPQGVEALGDLLRSYDLLA